MICNSVKERIFCVSGRRKDFSGQLFDPVNEDLRRIKLLPHNQDLES